MVDNIDQEMEELFADLGLEEGTPTEVSGTAPDTTSAEDSDTSAAEDASTNNDSADTTASEDSETSSTDSEPASDTDAKQESQESFSAEDKFTKQNKAFAEMRIKNKAYEDFLMQMARTAKLDVKNAQEAKDILASRIQQIEAKQKQISPEVLKELEDTRKRMSEMETERLKEHTLSDFAKLKSLHGLSDMELNAFADLLISKQKNPFEQHMDLIAEYRLLNFDKLIEQAREEGRKEEIARSAKAQNSSTNPSDQRATPDTGETKALKNVEDLDAFFKALDM